MSDGNRKMIKAKEIDMYKQGKEDLNMWLDFYQINKEDLKSVAKFREYEIVFEEKGNEYLITAGFSYGGEHFVIGGPFCGVKESGDPAVEKKNKDLFLMRALIVFMMIAEDLDDSTPDNVTYFRDKTKDSFKRWLPYKETIT